MSVLGLFLISPTFTYWSCAVQYGSQELCVAIKIKIKLKSQFLSAQQPHLMAIILDGVDNSSVS